MVLVGKKIYSDLTAQINGCGLILLSVCSLRPGQFRGQELVDWLVAAGLSSDRTSATSYAEQLQRSGLLTGHSSNFRDGLHIFWWTL